MRAGVKAAVRKTLITILLDTVVIKTFLSMILCTVYSSTNVIYFMKFLTGSSGWNVLMRFQLIFTGNMVCHVFVLNIN